jgi:DNA polymerase-3 subunit beta
MKIKTGELLSSVKRMLLFSSSNSKQVKFTLRKDNLEVSAEDIDRGSNAIESIMCDYNGEPMEIGFNTAYVNDVLSHVNNDEVIFKLHSPTKACIVEPSKIKDTEELLLLLMPVRLNN